MVMLILKKSGVLIVLSILILVQGCGPSCGDLKCEPGEDYQTCDKDCLECIDDDICTQDVYNYDTKKCQFIDIFPCCGNEVCEEGENFNTCSLDCPISKTPNNVIHSIIFYEEDNKQQISSLRKIAENENDYLDTSKYIQMPVSLDSIEEYIDISFDLTETTNTGIKIQNLSLQLVGACGQYGSLRILQYNKFGDYDTIGSIQCQTENWEEHNLILDLKRYFEDNIDIKLQKDSGTIGQLKIDYVALLIR